MAAAAQAAAVLCAVIERAKHRHGELSQGNARNRGREDEPLEQDRPSPAFLRGAAPARGVYTIVRSAATTN